MSQRPNKATRIDSLRNAYRSAFAVFRARVQHIQKLRAQPAPDPADLDQAMQQLDEAMKPYRDARNALAADLLRRPKEQEEETMEVCVR